MSLDNTAITFA